MKKLKMSKDLRYLEQFISDRKQNTHPSAKLLASFIEKKLDQIQKENIKLHLIECYECREIIININQYGQNKLTASNLIKWSPLILMVAVVVLFITPSNKKISLGMIDLSTAMNVEYQSIENPTLVNNIIDADALIAEISSSTKFANNTFFNEAIKAEQENAFSHAIPLYKQALMQTFRNLNHEERLKQKIVLHYKLLQVSYKNKEKLAIEEYKNILLYELRSYVLKYQKEEK